MKRLDLFDTKDMIDRSICLLRDHAPVEGYYLAFSGGKDSIVVKQLLVESGVPFDAHYNVTTIDPPELVRYIRKHHPDVEWVRPAKPLLSRMLDKKWPPTRMQRWCCAEYKEGRGAGRIVVTGIRGEESARRKKREEFESAHRGDKMFLHPILDWASDEVWEFIHSRNLPYCNLYDKGWHRVGCLFCPLAGRNQRLRQLSAYPGYEKLFRRYFRRLYKIRLDLGLPVDSWSDGDDMFEWWMELRAQHNHNCDSQFDLLDNEGQ